MRELPPPQLAALLKRLGLATEGDFERVEATVHRIAGSLPRFESVWIDALRQARCLTHFQAAEIHARARRSTGGRRCVLLQPVFDCGYSAVYRAEDRQTREIVRLAVFSPPSQDRDLLLAKLESLSALGKRLAGPAGLIVAAGLDGSHGHAASPWVEGTSLADFVLHHGRFPPQAVLEIARAMLGELVDLELVGRIGNPSYEPAGDNLRGRIGFQPVSADDESKRLDRLQTYPTAGLVHGDIRMQTVLIANDGEVHIPHPGLRGLIRPHEGMSCDNSAPDACSTLAPERVTEGTPPTTMSDLFACGCVWWHLLCGRPPLGGGDARSRLLAAQAAAIDDLHQWAADVPGVLVEAIGDCLQKDPRKRPQSMADLAQRLGPLRRSGRQTIARCLAAAAEPRAAWLRSKRTRKKAAHPHRVTAAALLVMAGVAVAWPLWVAGNRRPANAEIARRADPAEAKPPAARARLQLPVYCASFLLDP